jgi:DNA-binding transcriptional MerR regulator
VTERAASDRQSDKSEGRERSDGLLTTGDMARLTGNTLRTVRFYEEAGILRPDRRSAGGHRLFSQRERERLQFISDMRTAGLSLDEIRVLLDVKVKAENGEQAAKAALAALDRRITDLEDRIAALSRLKGELCGAREVLRDCKSCRNEVCFPDSCDDCDVMLGRVDVPQSVRVLWAVDRRGRSE